MTGARPLHVIAEDIRAHWPNMYLGAASYVDAMEYLVSVTDWYGADPASGIVRYFLANAGGWRGEHARRIKKELRDMIS